MSGTKIKICGLTRACDIQAANESRPDYIGFVFAKSRRQVSEEQAEVLAGQLVPGIQAVGVFVNAPTEQVIRLLQKDVIQLAQRQGQESQEENRFIQEKTGKPEIKAFSVETIEDIEEASKSPAEYLLFDHGAGGTGKAFDWSLAEKAGIMVKQPFFIAGGIRMENIEEAVRRTAPFGVDVSSGAETDGWKDPEKMRRLTEMVRRM